MAYNFLIVDDSAIIRTMVEKTLRLSGLEVGEVQKAANGREALACLEGAWVDAVLADINMPEMNGVELVEEMKKRGLMDTVPVIIISTERSVTRIEELKSRGVKAYLNKPFTPEAIREVVEQVLGKS